MTKPIWLATLLTCLTILLTHSAAAQTTVCGLEAEVCEISQGSYRIALPDGPAPDGGWPAMMFFHGAGGSGARTLANRRMVSSFLGRGYAVIAPDGLPRPNSRFGPGWSFHPDRPAQRDEAAFTRAVIADAAGRFAVNPERLLLSGFSIGGSLVWYLACQDPTLARAYAPVGGAFWRPHPQTQDCAGPVKLLHTHGWRDRVVPLEGRPLRGGAIYQGDVFAGLEILRELNSCNQMRADAFETGDRFWRRIWTSCTDGTALELILHPGGHAVPEGWGPAAVDWFEGLDTGG